MVEEYIDPIKRVKRGSTRYHVSNDAFIKHVKADAKKYRTVLTKVSDFHIRDYIVKNYAFYIEEIDDNRRMIWFYDYDKQKYVLDDSLLFKAISEFDQKFISDARLKSFIKALNEYDYSMEVRQLDENEIPMKNCIVNYHTLEEIDYSPDIFVLSRINNEYQKIDEHPQTLQNLNIFDIIKATADDNEERYRGLLQVIRQTLLKKNLDDSIILFIGPGGHGKSMLANFITNIIGQQNVTNITLDQFSDKDDVLSVNNAHAVIGDDIDDDVYINKLKNLKAISAGNSITVSPKFEKAVRISFTGPIIQLTPGLIKMSERNGQMRRRLKPYAFNRDFTKEENKIEQHQLTAFLENKEVQQYFIYQLLNMEELQNLDDFIGWDVSLLEDTTELNDSSVVFQDYIKNHTNLLQMERLPLGVLKAVYCDALDLEEGSQASKISTKEIIRRSKDFFRLNGYKGPLQGKRMRQQQAKDYLFKEPKDMTDDEFYDYLMTDVEELNEPGEFTSKCLDDNKTSGYLQKETKTSLNDENQVNKQEKRSWNVLDDFKAMSIEQFKDKYSKRFFYRYIYRVDTTINEEMKANLSLKGKTNMNAVKYDDLLDDFKGLLMTYGKI